MVFKRLFLAVCTKAVLWGVGPVCALDIKPMEDGLARRYHATSGLFYSNFSKGPHFQSTLLQNQELEKLTLAVGEQYYMLKRHVETLDRVCKALSAAGFYSQDYGALLENKIKLDDAAQFVRATIEQSEKQVAEMGPLGVALAKGTLGSIDQKAIERFGCYGHGVKLSYTVHSTSDLCILLWPYVRKLDIASLPMEPHDKSYLMSDLEMLVQSFLDPFEATLLDTHNSQAGQWPGKGGGLQQNHLGFWPLRHMGQGVHNIEKAVRLLDSAQSLAFKPDDFQNIYTMPKLNSKLAGPDPWFENVLLEKLGQAGMMSRRYHALTRIRQALADLEQREPSAFQRFNDQFEKTFQAQRGLWGWVLSCREVPGHPAEAYEQAAAHEVAVQGTMEESRHFDSLSQSFEQLCVFLEPYMKEIDFGKITDPLMKARLEDDLALIKSVQQRFASQRAAALAAAQAANPIAVAAQKVSEADILIIAQSMKGVPNIQDLLGDHGDNLKNLALELQKKFRAENTKFSDDKVKNDVDVLEEVLRARLDLG